MKVNRRYCYTQSAVDYHTNDEDEIASWEYGPPIVIPPHPGFELVKAPKGTVKKAYGQFYRADTEDLEIEFAEIKKYEDMQYFIRKDLEREEITEEVAREKWDEVKEKLIFHYKKAISIISPKYSLGWNRWSEDILELFVDDRMHRVLWGSGNCGKSAVTGLLLYTKWRVNPRGRMVVLAAKVLKESEERVAGYIKEIHMDSPKSSIYKFAINPSSKNDGIYCMIKDKHSGKLVPGDRSCIVHLPVKMNRKDMDNLSNIITTSGGEELDDSLFLSDVGGNLLGKHPDDRLILAFDEAQEIPGVILRSRIFSNWYTNEKVDVFAWGNPAIINISAPHEHDLLYSLGTSNLNYLDVKEIETKSGETGWWWWDDTKVLHLTMLDSPKEDQDEIDWARYSGRERLTFLAGNSNVERIKARTKQDSPSWYAQVLGFPYLIDTAQGDAGVLAPATVKTCSEYPLLWVDEDKCEWFMGVDPSISGHYDKAAIVIGRMGLMTDGRMGVDIMHGKYCENIEPVEGVEFSDVAVNRIYDLCLKHNIPLKNVSIEAHATGEVFRYALQKHIEKGEKRKWADEYGRGEMYHIVNPMQSPTERILFRKYEKFEQAKDVVANMATEFWVAIRCAVISRQMFNLPDVVLQQFYSRYLERVQNGTRFRIETKQQMRKRGLKSPNEADAVSFMFDLMRNRGFRFAYYGKWQHKEIYGEEYFRGKAQDQVMDGLGVVGRMLGLGDKIRVAGGGEREGKRRQESRVRRNFISIDGV